MSQLSRWLASLVNQEYVRKVQRKAVNLTIDKEVLLAAREHKLNLSRILEETLRAELQALTQDEWRQRNKEAIDAYNARVESHGVFSDKIRRF